MNKLKKLASDTVLFTISNFSSKLLVFLLIPLYTSQLTTEEMGIADLITNVVNFVFPIMTMSLIEAVLRFSFEDKYDKRQLFSNTIKVSFLGFIILLLLSPIATKVQGVFFDNWYAFITLFLGFALSNTVSNYLKGCNKTKEIAVFGVIQTIMTIALNIIFIVLLKMGIKGYILSLVCSYYVSTALIVIITKLYRDFMLFNTDFAVLKDMISYSMPIIPSKIAWWVNNSADKYFIIYTIGIAGSGLYGVAHKIPSIITTMADIFNQAWQISAIDTYVKNGADDSFYNDIHRYFLQFVLVASSFVVIFSEIFGMLLFKGDFLVAWKYIAPLVVSAAFACFSGFYHSIFRAAMLAKELSYSVLIGSVVNISLNYPMIKIFGIIGAAYATMIAFAVEWIFSYYIAKRAVYLSEIPVKTVITTLLLIIECFIMCNDVTNKYYISILIIIAILFLSIDLIKEVISIVLKLCKRVKK